MASSIDISTYSAPVQISSSNNTYVNFQFVASGLDADVTIKLQHSSDGVNFFDISDTKTLSNPSDSEVLETYNFTLSNCYVTVDVGSATTGTINIFGNSKKKEDNVKGVQSALNTSTTLLTASSTYTGTFEQNDYPDVLIQINTDQNGTIYFDFSSDGTNVDTTLTFYYNTSRINPPHIFIKANRYFRVRFENTSASDQTYLRLDTYYGSYEKLTAPINGTLAENYDAIVVRPTDYRSEVAMSKRQGRTTWNKFGYNPDVDSASGDEIVASFGGALGVNFDIITTADTLDIVSTSANDTSAGTGAQSVLIVGIDENFLSVTEIVTLNGTTPVTTANNYLGVNRMIVLVSGTNRTNVGTINATDTGASFGIQAQIPPSNSVTQQCIFHTQINHNFLSDWLFMNALKLSGGGAPRVRFKAFSYSRVTNTLYQVFRHDQDTGVENTVAINPTQPFVIGGREVLFFTMSSDTNNTKCDVRFSGIEERVS